MSVMSANGWPSFNRTRGTTRVEVPAALRPALQWFTAMDPVERMQFALVVSIAIHAFVIFFVGFKPFERFKDSRKDLKNNGDLYPLRGVLDEMQERLENRMSAHRRAPRITTDKP